MIPVDLRKQQALDADPRAIQQINFTGNLDLVQSRGFLGRHLGPVLKVGLPLMKNMLQPLVKTCFNTTRINSSRISCRRRNT